MTDVLKEIDITAMTEEGAIPIDGTLEKDKLGYVYFQDEENTIFDDQSAKIFNLMSDNREYKSDGTMMSTNTVIITPNNILFHGLSFSGPDPKNWVRGFEKGVQKSEILGGQIQGPKMTYEEFVDRFENNDIDTEEYVNLISYKRIGQNFEFILTDGTKYKLSDCEIYMPFGDREVYTRKIGGIREVLKGRTRES